MANVFENEKNWRASNQIDVTYLEDPYGIANYEGTKKLLFIFQSLGDEKSENEIEKFPWTMVNGFRHLNCRKIYIKDNYGMVGCYYLGLNGKFDVECAVLEFMKQKITEYSILLKDVMLYGNSKGAYAALNFGFRLGGVNICSFVPQFDLYSWIMKYKPHLKYIMPDEITNETILLYKNYLANVMNHFYGIQPNIVILTSRNDNTYEEHIPLLLDVLEKKKFKYEIVYNDELYITRHNNVVKNSINYLYYYISKWLVEK